MCVCNLFFNFELNFLIFLEIRCDDAFLNTFNTTILQII